MLDYIRKQEQLTADNHDVCNMDIEDEREAAPETKVGNQQHTQIQNNPLITSKESTPTRESPSLTELESQKEQLLAELTDKPAEEPQTPVKPAVVKTSSFGTPILKTTTLYANLPESDNFSQNISPVINFENLPNSTGKYEQLSGVLQKVRDTMKELQNRAQSWLEGMLREREVQKFADSMMEIKFFNVKGNVFNYYTHKYTFVFCLGIFQNI